MSNHPAFTPKLGATNVKMLLAYLNNQKHSVDHPTPGYTAGYMQATHDAIIKVETMWSAAVSLSKVDEQEVNRLRSADQESTTLADIASTLLWVNDALSDLEGGHDALG